MNFKYILIVLYFLALTFTQAEKVNIINSTPGAVLVIDGKVYRSNSVYNLDLDPGSHHVKVQLGTDVIYEQIFDVLKDQTTTVDTNVLGNNAPLANTSINSAESNAVGNMGKLSVINDTAGAKISINGLVYDQNRVFNVELPAGTHHVVVNKGKETLYSEVVTVTKGNVSTIDTNYQSMLAPKSIRKKKLKEIKQVRGSTGIGFQLQNLSGWSVKRYFGPLALQLTGFITKESTPYYFPENYDDQLDDQAYSANARVLLNLSEKIGVGGLPVRMFIGVGYGIDTCDDSYSLEGNEWNWNDAQMAINVERNVKQVLFGVEFDSRVGSFSLGFEYAMEDIMGRKIVSEYDYDWDDDNDNGGYYAVSDESFTDSLNSFNFNFGYHFYF